MRLSLTADLELNDEKGAFINYRRALELLKPGHKNISRQLSSIIKQLEKRINK